MSHYTTMKVNFKESNEKDLIAALKEHFGEDGVEIHDTPEEMKIWDGTSALAKNHYGMAPKCHIIIRKDTLCKKLGSRVLTNDLGYIRDGNGGYECHLDPVGFPVKDQGLVSQSYTSKVAERKLKAQGYTLKRERTKDGKIRLTATRYAK